MPNIIAVVLLSEGEAQTFRSSQQLINSFLYTLSQLQRVSGVQDEVLPEDEKPERELRTGFPEWTLIRSRGALSSFQAGIKHPARVVYIAQDTGTVIKEPETFF